MNAYDIIRRPVITEQSMESVADKKYVFMVDVNANKTEIKAAIEEIFGVKVAKFQWGNFQSRKRPAPPPDPEPEVPASEAVIDAEVVDLPDEPAARLKDDER